jgi:Flp pilus assembly protein TadB
MVERLVFGASLLAVAALVFRLWWTERLRGLCRARLAEEAPQLVEAVVSRPAPPRAKPVLRRFRSVGLIVGVFVAALIHQVVRLNSFYAVMFGIIVGIIAYELEVLYTTRRALKIEVQLADAIDLLVAALQAGASVTSSLETALAESRAPLRSQLEEMLGRIKYGDNPQTVFQGLAARVPLETFRLFSSALIVHAEVGGNLAPSLATVGRIIRDRIELTRRIRSLVTQSRASTFAILVTTYFIGLIMWRRDPPRMEAFLGSTIGSAATSFAVVMQAIGILWSSAMSRLKY